MKKQIEQLKAAAKKYLEIGERVELEPTGTKKWFILRNMEDRALEAFEELCDPRVIVHLIDQGDAGE